MSKHFYASFPGMSFDGLSEEDRRRWMQDPMTVVLSLRPLSVSEGARQVFDFHSVPGHDMPLGTAEPACVFIRDDTPPDTVIEFLVGVTKMLSDTLSWWASLPEDREYKRLSS